MEAQDFWLSRPILLRQQLDLEECSIDWKHATMELVRSNHDCKNPAPPNFAPNQAEAFCRSQALNWCKWETRNRELGEESERRAAALNKLYVSEFAEVNSGAAPLSRFPVPVEMLRAKLALDQLRDSLTNMNDEWVAFHLKDERWQPHLHERYCEARDRWKEMRADFERTFLA